MKEQLRKLIEAERKERRKLADEEALGKIQALEEQVAQLKQGIASQKQEEVNMFITASTESVVVNRNEEQALENVGVYNASCTWTSRTSGMDGRLSWQLRY